MAADPKVIDAEFEPVTSDTPTVREGVVRLAANTARTVSGGLKGAGFDRAAEKASAVAEVAEVAQQTYEALAPGLSALGRFVRRMEELGIISYSERAPLRKVK